MRNPNGSPKNLGARQPGNSNAGERGVHSERELSRGPAVQRRAATSVDAASEGIIFAPPRQVDSLTDCSFYHTMEIPGHGTVDGEWDLRPGIASYLGSLDFAGRQVLEIGPASGFLTFEMERGGADVTSVEVSSDYVWDFVPQGSLDLAAIREERRDIMRRLANGFWFAHSAFGSNARVHYGSAYDLPDALGQFNIAVLACVLLHCRDTLAILANCARIASDAVVVVEPVLSEQTGQPIARLHPSAENGSWDMWWNFTPEYFVQALGVLGFPHATVTHHTQLRLGSTIPMFTVVGRRTPELEPDARTGNGSAARGARIKRRNVVDVRGSGP